MVEPAWLPMLNVDYPVTFRCIPTLLLSHINSELLDRQLLGIHEKVLAVCGTSNTFCNVVEVAKGG